MAVQLTIPYETLVELVEQLPYEERTDLAERLARLEQKPRNVDKWIAMFDAAVLHVEINEAPSIRREDWYGDDGR
jgi:uncharacterized protein YheU (UPF0270 family)